jgi:hypothetical protein
VLKLFENDMVCMPNFLFVLLALDPKEPKGQGLGEAHEGPGNFIIVLIRVGHSSQVISLQALFSASLLLSVYEYYNPSFIPLAENAIPLIPCLRWRPARLAQVILLICRFRNK